MYRYAQSPRSARFRRKQTLLALSVLLLFLLCLSLVYVYVQSVRVNNNTHEVLFGRIQTETSNAKTRAYQLSQTGGSRIEALIASVRQHVYAVRVLNEMSSGIWGAGTQLVDETLINACVSQLDQCDLLLQTGGTLTATFVNLRTAIDVLFDAVSLL